MSGARCGTTGWNRRLQDLGSRKHHNNTKVMWSGTTPLRIMTLQFPTSQLMNQSRSKSVLLWARICHGLCRSLTASCICIAKPRSARTVSPYVHRTKGIYALAKASGSLESVGHIRVPYECSTLSHALYTAMGK